MLNKSYVETSFIAFVYGLEREPLREEKWRKKQASTTTNDNQENLMTKLRQQPMISNSTYASKYHE